MINLPTTPQSGIRFAMVVSLILAVIKAIIGFLSGSLAILGSAMDSFLDMFVSLTNSLALWISGRRGNKKYEYGLGKVQGFAAIFEGIVVLSSGVLLAWTGYRNFVTHHTPDVAIMEIAVMGVAILGTLAIVSNFLRLSRIHDSLIIRADALHYSSDLWMNTGILLALLATRFIGWWWADAVFALIIGLFIIKNALPIIWSGISMLLDRALSPEEQRVIQAIFLAQEDLESFHYLKTRRSGDDVFIEAHIVFRDKDISLRDAHAVSDQIESELAARFPVAMITLHLDIDPEPELCDIVTKTCD